VNDKNILVLASNSPRRKQLLALGNWNFVVNVADIDEAVLEGETPKEYVLIRLAQEKALAVKDKANVENIIIGSDTTVVVDDTILGKPDRCAGS
jgi:septum formation protein